MKPWSKKTGCWLLAVGLAGSAMARRPEPNAFLNKPAHTTQELVRQAKADPQVMDRFMRHFGMDRQEVIALLSSLHLATLKKDTPMTVYNCSEKDGAIRSRLFAIKAGSWIFVDASGTPILKKTCGNPFWAKPPEAPTEVETETLPASVRTEQIMTSMETMPAAELVEPPFDVPEPLAIPPQPLIEIPEIEEFSKPSRRTALWPLLLVLVPLDHPGGRPKNEPPVPGPAGALMFAVPALAGALKRRRRGPRS